MPWPTEYYTYLIRWRMNILRLFLTHNIMTYAGMRWAMFFCGFCVIFFSLYQKSTVLKGWCPKENFMEIKKYINCMLRGHRLKSRLLSFTHYRHNTQWWSPWALSWKHYINYGLRGNRLSVLVSTLSCTHNIYMLPTELVSQNSRSFQGNFTKNQGTNFYKQYYLKIKLSTKKVFVE